MMILSRVWVLILSLLVGAAIYIVSLAVGQYNRSNAKGTEEALLGDGQVVNWALQIDARRRLDTLILASADGNVVKSLKAANGKDIPPSAKDEGKKALQSFNETKLKPEYKNDVLFLVDRDGRMVAQVGYDSVNAFPEFELGGYAAVFDALHGYLRDDSWVLGGKLARVVTRPVEDELGQPPLGAIVGIRWVDSSFAKDLSARTRTNLAFFVQGSKVASASQEGFQETLFDQLTADDLKIEANKVFSDVRPIGGDKSSLVSARLPGEAWELGVSVAVMRTRTSIAGPMAFISGADDKDKASVKTWLVVLSVVVGAGVGILLSFVEHSRPLGEVRAQAAKLKKGEIDYLQLPRFGGEYRAFAQDINAGIERVIEKGGGAARKPADLESILGPVPAQPNMSAFSFPLSGPTFAPGQQAPVISGAGGPPKPFVPPASASAPGLAAPPAPPAPLSAPAPLAAPPSAPGGMGAPKPLAPPKPIGAAPPPLAPPAPLAPPPVPVAASSPALSPSSSVPSFGAISGSIPAMEDDGNEDERTMIARPAEPEASSVPAPAGDGSEGSDWLQVYDDYVRTKKQCNESTDGLTFEKFQVTLKKNRDALMSRHGVKRVKFSVYVKEGKASLKATPVRE